MRKIALILALAFTLGACSKNGYYSSVEEMVEKTQEKVKVMTPEKLNELMENYEIYTLIDVRQELEHYYGFIPGTVNIPRGSLEFRISSPEFWDVTGLYEPEKGELIILYCEKGQRSVLAAESLMRLGYTNVYTLKDGWKAWELAYPDIYEKDLDKLSGQGDKPKDVGSC
jgi:rhodanese-related sulfurtransferase